MLRAVTTTKILLFIDVTVAIFLTASVVYGVFNDVDTTPITIVAGFWDTQLGVVIGAYFWKSKNENRSKYAMKLVKDLAEQYGIENVISLAEVILKD